MKKFNVFIAFLALVFFKGVFCYEPFEISENNGDNRKLMVRISLLKAKRGFTLANNRYGNREGLVTLMVSYLNDPNKVNALRKGTIVRNATKSPVTANWQDGIIFNVFPSTINPTEVWIAAYDANDITTPLVMAPLPGLTWSEFEKGAMVHGKVSPVWWGGLVGQNIDGYSAIFQTGQYIKAPKIIPATPTLAQQQAALDQQNAFAAQQHAIDQQKAWNETVKKIFNSKLPETRGEFKSLPGTPFKISKNNKDNSQLWISVQLGNYIYALANNGYVNNGRFPNTVILKIASYLNNPNKVNALRNATKSPVTANWQDGIIFSIFPSTINPTEVWIAVYDANDISTPLVMALVPGLTWSELRGEKKGTKYIYWFGSYIGSYIRNRYYDDSNTVKGYSAIFKANQFVKSPKITPTIPTLAQQQQAIDQQNNRLLEAVDAAVDANEIPEDIRVQYAKHSNTPFKISKNNQDNSQLWISVRLSHKIYTLANNGNANNGQLSTIIPRITSFLNDPNKVTALRKGTIVRNATKSPMTANWQDGIIFNVFPSTINPTEVWMAVYDANDISAPLVMEQLPGSKWSQIKFSGLSYWYGSYVDGYYLNVGGYSAIFKAGQSTKSPKIIPPTPTLAQQQYGIDQQKIWNETLKRLPEKGLLKAIAEKEILIKPAKQESGLFRTIKADLKQLNNKL